MHRTVVCIAQDLVRDIIPDVWVVYRYYIRALENLCIKTHFVYNTMESSCRRPTCSSKFSFTVHMDDFPRYTADSDVADSKHPYYRISTLGVGGGVNMAFCPVSNSVNGMVF